MPNLSSPKRVAVIGAGISGAVAAYVLARQDRTVVDVYDPAPGGLCRSRNIEGVDVHLFGPHVLHTNDWTVWRLFNEISPFYAMRATASILTDTGQAVPVPVNASTLMRLCGYGYRDAVRRLFFAQSTPPGADDTVASWGGRILPTRAFDMCVRGYTERMWSCDCEMVPAATLARLPIYPGRQRAYHADRFSGLPVNGWSAWFVDALRDARVFPQLLTPTDIAHAAKDYDAVVYTGRLDYLYDYCLGVLPARGFAHRVEVLRDWPWPSPIMHTPSLADGIRRTNYARLHGFGYGPHIVGIEKPSASENLVYPVLSGEALAAEYTRMLRKDYPRMYPCGRMAEYRYLGIAQCATSALHTCEKIIGKIFALP